MREERLKEVLSDEEFVKELIAMKTAEERQAALKEKGVDVTIEEINKVRDAVIKLNAAGGIGPNGEIDEALLEEVAGGELVLWLCLAGVFAVYGMCALISCLG